MCYASDVCTLCVCAVIMLICLLPASATASQQYNHTNHAYEILLGRDSQVDLAPEDAESAQIPMVVYNVSLWSRGIEVMCICHSL